MREQTNSRVPGRESYRAGGIRTRDLLHPRQALYQAEPQPELTAALEIKRDARIYFAYSGCSSKVEYARNFRSSPPAWLLLDDGTDST